MSATYHRVFPAHAVPASKHQTKQAFVPCSIPSWWIPCPSHCLEALSAAYTCTFSTHYHEHLSVRMTPYDDCRTP